MIEIQTTSTLFLIKEKMLSPEGIDKMLRTAATSTLGLMKRRIHINGLNANEQPIGIYSKGYMVLRTGSFKNAPVIKKGKRAGKLRNAGVFTDRTIRLNKQTGVFTGEEKVGKKRPRYNRTNDPKVVASLTRQMENDMKVIATGPNSYGIGYSNKHNFDKSQWVEATYKMKDRIFSLSPTEITAINLIVKKFVDNAIP
jgi:hypothetical protein